MHIVGVVEIVAGLVVAIMPRFGALLGALALFRLATAFSSPTSRAG